MDNKHVWSCTGFSMVDSLDPELVKMLSEHSPRLFIIESTLVPSIVSPTGWVLVIPGDDGEKMR